MNFRQYEATQQAVSEARNAGVFGETEKRLKRMARRAAPVTHPAGNRRYLDFVLLVKDGIVSGVTRLSPDDTVFSSHGGHS